MNSKIEAAIQRLENVTPTSGGYTARCPTHDDNHNSLSIFNGRDGRVHINCLVNCGFAPIEAMGLTVDDLKGENIKPLMSGLKKKSRQPRRTTELDEPWEGLTVAQYAEAKRLEPGMLHAIGIRDTMFRAKVGEEWVEKPAVRIPYWNVDGQQTRDTNARIRAAMSGKMKFRWEISGMENTLYGLWLAPQMWKSLGYALIVEGESDCHTLWQFGLPAIGLPGAAHWKEERDAPIFDGYENILVFIEPDDGGDAVERWLASSRIRHRARRVRLGEHKDPSTLYLQDPLTFRTRLQAAFAQAFSERR